MAVQDTGSPALVLKILNMMQSLSKSEQAVATYITQHPEEVVYLSVAALAENSGVSDPTVVRACQKLGFTGYQDLKVTLAQEFWTRWSGWIPSTAPIEFPSIEEIVAPFEAAGCRCEVGPLWGRTPFNSHLVVASYSA